MLSNPLLQFLFKILIFIVIIYTLQSGFEYLKDTYTKPKVKDLVNTQIKKYKEIVAEMKTPEEKHNINRRRVILPIIFRNIISRRRG